MGFWETLFKSIVLGTVQGLTEFLPVSSSGHLVLLEHALGYSVEGGGTTLFNVMLHLGTLLAVLIAFRKDIRALFSCPRKIAMLLVATVPAGVAGLLFESKIDALFGGERGIAAVCLLFGVTAVLLLICELCALRRKKVRPFGWRNALSMGFMQAAAILPGLSRSGSTIAAGVCAGADAEESSRFSFLMSIPIILGSAAVGILKAASSGTAAWSAAGVCGMLAGIASSAIFGFFAIKIMLKAMGRANYKWFALYLLLLSVCTLWLDMTL